ncbi:hypothetical protein WMF30_41070 [Sorangium sp. So ce134]
MIGRRHTALQWNMGVYYDRDLSEDVRRSRFGVLGTLVAKHAPSIVALQEAPEDLQRQRVLGPRYRVISAPGGIATAVLQPAWKVLDYSGMERWRALVVQIDPRAGGLGLGFWNMHLPILFKDSEERRASARCEPLADLRRFRAHHPARGEIVSGDFNLEPHDSAMTGRDGFYARGDLEWVLSTASRRDMSYRALYNATLSALERGGPPYGSRFRDKGTSSAGPWYMPDQVLMSAEIVRYGKPKVTLLTHAGSTALCDAHRGCPDRKVGSDHLPLLIEFTA